MARLRRARRPRRDRSGARNFPGTSRPGSVGQRLPYQRVKAVRVDEATGARTDLPPGHTVIEDALLTHPAVTAASAVEGPDEHAGEVPVGYVTIAPGAPVTPDELTAWAAARVPERLARIGIGGVHAELADGLVTVLVPRTDHKDAAAAALNAYAITWRFD